MLAGYLRDGMEYLSASTVRRVVQVASMSVVGSAIAVSRLDKEVRRVTTTYPDEDPVTLADHMVRMCEEEVLDWMGTRTVHPGPDADPDPAGSPTRQELVEDLEKILAREEAGKYPPPGSKEDAWMMKVLEQATKVRCFAEEVCDKTTKRDWQSCTYQKKIPVANGSGGGTSLRPLWGSRGGRGQGKGPEVGQGMANQGTGQHQRSKNAHGFAAS
jgi:hypothetical protein